MKVMKVESLALLLVVMAVNRCIAVPPQVQYSHAVSKTKPLVFSTYTIQNTDTIAVLNTVPVAGEEFVDGSGKLVSSKLHGGQGWQIPIPVSENNSKTLVKAVSPPIPKNESSCIFVNGKFKQGGNGGGASKGVIAPKWSSLIEEPGAHVILAHQYHDDTIGVLTISSGLALLNLYPAANKRLLVQIGDGSGTDHLPDITGLAAYLTGKGLAEKDIVTLDSLGHGIVDPIAQSEVTLIKSGMTPVGYHIVGNSDDLQADPLLENTISSSDYVQNFSGFLKDESRVMLWHCWSGQSYKSFDGNNTMSSPILSFVKALGVKRNVGGLTDMVQFMQGQPPKSKAGGAIVFVRMPEVAPN